MIGSAIFILPSQVAAQLGAWSPLAFLVIGFASLLVALCFAEVGSRFEGTGGSYLYTRAAFGRFVGFEVGWMQWFTRVTGHAAVVNALALALGFYWPTLMGGVGRPVVVTVVTLMVGWINLRGIRSSANVINLFTIGKLVPLALFILVGLWFVDVDRLRVSGGVPLPQLSAGALLLIFAFGGFDNVGVPAGEATDPRRHVPFALVATIVVVTAVMTLAQIVAMGTLPDLAASTTPIADASLLYMGAAGALIVSAGAVVSMIGSNMGHVLIASRTIFALAENGDLPRPFAKVNPRLRTPSNAIIFSTFIALALALSGSFATLAAANAVARLVIYTGACAATLRLRNERFRGTINAPAFTSPLGSLVPLLAIGVSMLILAGATQQQLLGGAAALAAGGVLYILKSPGANPSRP